MKLNVTFLAFLACALLGGTVSKASIVVTFGNSQSVRLVGGQAVQIVEFYASGEGIFVDGLEFNIQIDDGGSDLGGTSIGPVISSIDLVTGTIFQVASPEQQDVETLMRARQSTVDTAFAVEANGLIATVAFNTTESPIGQYDLLLLGVAGQFNTTFFNVGVPLAADVRNGNMNVVAIPESSTFAICLVVAVGLLLKKATSQKSLVGRLHS